MKLGLRLAPVPLLAGALALVQATQAGPTGRGGNDALADTVYVDTFNRPDGPLGADWSAGAVYAIVSGEASNTDTSEVFDDVATYAAHTNPLGVAMQFSPSADSSNLDDAGLALRLNGTDPATVDGYFLYKSTDNRWNLFTIIDGITSVRVGRSGLSSLPFLRPGDTIQVKMTSDGSGHHFRIFVNDRFDLQMNDANKVQGNAATLYSGILLAGGPENNNVDAFAFLQSSDDATPPAAITDLSARPDTPTSVRLSWTAPGDDGGAGTAGYYDIRWATVPLTESNWATATPVEGETHPLAAGSAERFTVDGLSPNILYYFAIKTSDGFPNDNLSGISNSPSSQALDATPPGQITDLRFDALGPYTIRISWTAPGDDGMTGTATSYDVRYRPDPLNQSTWATATQAQGEPTPLPAGNRQEFTVGGLSPETAYWIAVKAKDEQNNVGTISNVVADFTAPAYQQALDDFNRESLGPNWSADPENTIANSQMTNTSTAEDWGFVSLFSAVRNVGEIAFRWGVGTDADGAGNGGPVFFSSPSPDGDGYMLFRHDNLDRWGLWDVRDGNPSTAINTFDSNVPDPVAGSIIRVVLSSDANGHQFDLYVNGQYDGRITDPGKIHNFGTNVWAGVMLHGNRNNDVDDFRIGGLDVNIAPTVFNLLSPEDDVVVTTGTPRLDWADSFDPNIGDTVRYRVLFGTSANFDPDSTTVVDSLLVSEYQIPAWQLLRYRPAAQGIAPSRGRALSRWGGPARARSGGDEGVQTLPDDARIFWKVFAFDKGGSETPSSQQDWSFWTSIPDPPNPFTQLYPANGGVVNVRSPLMTWHRATDPDPGDVSTYTLSYDVFPDFRTAVNIAGLSDTSFTVPPLNDLTSYYWKVKATDGAGLQTETFVWTFFVNLNAVGVGDQPVPGAAIPKAYALGANYPNPFNPRTAILYDVPASAGQGVPVSLTVFSMRGEKVQTLVGGLRTPGRYSVTWDGRDSRGDLVPSGVYLYRMSAGRFQALRKMVLLK